MKRFFCGTCGRIKHVRRMPENVVAPNAVAVTDRVGHCRWHQANDKAILMNRERIKTIKHVKSAAPATPPKEKKGKR
jgi:hypothetical protein